MSTEPGKAKPEKVPIEEQRSELERIETEHGAYWARQKGMDDGEYASRMRRLRGAIETLRWVERNRAKLKDIR